MRTTVDIPEGLLRQARARAALAGIKMKDVVNLALQQYLGVPSKSEEIRGHDLPPQVEISAIGRFQLPVIRSPKPGAASIGVDRFKEADDAGDVIRYASTFGR